MTTRRLALLACSALLSVAFAQQPATNAEGTFHFTTPQNPQALQEAATIVRSVMSLPQASIESAQSTLLFKGPAPEVAAAEWALGELDRPGGETATHAYPLPNGDLVRVSFVPNASTTQSMQELLTVLRTVADIQKIFNFTTRQAIVMQAKEGDINFAQWIIDQLNRPGPQQDLTPQSYSAMTPYGMVARVNALPKETTVQGMQQILTVLRTVADIQKVFNYTANRALILRARPAEMDRAEWLIQQLNEPSAGTHVFNPPAGDDVTRVFYLPNATPQGLQSALTAIRTDTHIMKAFNTSNTLTARGTADQIAAAAQLIAQRNGF